jgi:transcriptional repressor NrdR
MKCPFCSNLTNKVIDSRLSKDGDSVRRRRVCLECGKRFTTRERLEDDLPMVIKKDGSRQPFDRKKIWSGIQIACKKRPVSVDDIEKIVERIEKKVIDMGEKEVHSSFIGEAVMQELYKLDHVAYVRFASVYREFKDINEFMDELRNLLDKNDLLSLSGGVDATKKQKEPSRIDVKSSEPEIETRYTELGSKIERLKKKKKKH